MMKYADIPGVVMLAIFVLSIGVYYGAKFGWYVGILFLLAYVVFWFGIGKYMDWAERKDRGRGKNEVEGV